MVQTQGWARLRDIPDLLDDFCNEVLDQQVRLDIEKRYGSLRDAIVKHAFQPLGDVTKSK